MCKMQLLTNIWGIQYFVIIINNAQYEIHIEYRIKNKACKRKYLNQFNY